MPVRVAWNDALTRASIVIAHDPGNIITEEIVRQMRACLEDLTGARGLRLVTIEGAGADFSFGASVPEHRAEHIGRVLPETHALIADLLACPSPTAAIVRGRCVGGGFELALACDFIFAADSATFALPEIALGVFPPAGAVLLPWRAGGARATSAVLTGAPRSAAEWFAAGLIERLVPETELEQALNRWFAATLGRFSAEALRHAVRTARTPLLAAVEHELPEAERRYLAELMRSEDAREGIAAFLEKRQPRWKDQ
jgi:cyclohexa-1,5-dienecarbonyl-CoA hydratase